MGLEDHCCVGAEIPQVLRAATSVAPCWNLRYVSPGCPAWAAMLKDPGQESACKTTGCASMWVGLELRLDLRRPFDPVG